MSLSLAHVNAVSKAIRGLCLGRVYLKANMAAEATLIPVGQADADGAFGDLPGSQLFFNTVLTGTLVQPAASSVPGASGIEHSEAVTLVQPAAGALHLSANAGVAHSYTTARGAYLQMSPQPSVCSGLEIIVKDFLEDTAEPEDRYFPGIFVTWMGTRYPPLSNQAYRESMTFLVRYAILEQTGRDNREALLDDVAVLVGLLAEDNYLGGTVNESNVSDIVSGWDPRSAYRGRRFVSAKQRQILWVDVLLDVWRAVVWDKVSA